MEDKKLAAKQKALKRQRDWKRENTRSVSIVFTKSSGVSDALDKMSEKTGIRPIQYARTALVEKLKEDGYLEK